MGCLVCHWAMHPGGCWVQQLQAYSTQDDMTVPDTPAAALPVSCGQHCCRSVCEAQDDIPLLMSQPTGLSKHITRPHKTVTGSLVQNLPTTHMPDLFL